MSTTELDEVQTLLVHVLPDPAGYAQRLLLQAMNRWGQLAEPSATAFYAASSPEDNTNETFISADQLGETEPPIDTNILLAAALGACECWGLEPNCHVCFGHGRAGWTEPEPDLFNEFVRPAIARLPGMRANGTELSDVVKAR
jgi:hypothetical protein